MGSQRADGFHGLTGTHLIVGLQTDPGSHYSVGFHYIMARKCREGYKVPRARNPQPDYKIAQARKLIMGFSLFSGPHNPDGLQPRVGTQSYSGLQVDLGHPPLTYI